ncbi:MAG: hypothetical protein PHC88_13580 [Terrimicrobiaceae bacterium]|nr:hypothetical protein [Terrimicrobiaceae bacterium]
MIPRLVALFFVPLLGAIFLFIPHGDGFIPALSAYIALLLGMGLFVAPTMVESVGARIATGLALAVGMFLVHLVVGVAGCTFAVAAFR